MKGYFKNTVVVVLFLCLCSVSFAQRKSVSVKNSAIIDGIENELVYKFSFPDSELSWCKMFTSKNKFGIDIIYGRPDSSNVIYALHSYRNKLKWEAGSKEIDFSSSYKPMGGIFSTIYGKTKYPIYMFYGDSVLSYSLLTDSRSQWVNNRKLAVLLSAENSIIGVLSAGENHAGVLLNSVNDKQENCVISAMSEDNGFNWELTSIAVKHNLVELKGWCVASKRRNPNSSYMILTDKQNQPYYAHSGNGGRTWSYPKKLSSLMMGDNYKMSIDNGYVVVVFRCIADGEVNRDLVDANNDIMLWYGTFAEFVNGSNKHGNLVKVIDNSVDSPALDYSVEDVTYYKNNRYYVLIKNWSDNSTSLQLHLVRRN